MTPYSLTQVVADGRLTAPRWAHHLVKVATSLAIGGGLWLIHVPLLVAGWIASAGLMLYIKWKPLSNPHSVERTTHTSREVWGDAANDLALASVTLAAAYYLHGNHAIAYGIGVWCLVTWGGCHRFARP